MKFAILSIVLAYSFPALSLDEDLKRLYLEEKIQLMSFGEGVASGTNGFGTISECGNYESEALHDLPRKLFCEKMPGVEVVRIRTKNGYALYKLIITNKNFRTPYGLLKEVTEEGIKSILGEPYNTIGKVLDYEIPTVMNSHTIFFSIENGMVSKIEWQWTMD